MKSVLLIASFALFLPAPMAQSSNREEILRVVFRAVLSAGYPWAGPSPSSLLRPVPSPCKSVPCSTADPNVGGLTPRLESFVRDTLKVPIVNAPITCPISDGRSPIGIDEPVIDGETALVHVVWRGCGRNPLGRDVFVADAVIELKKRDGSWVISRLASQTIS